MAYEDPTTRSSKPKTKSANMAYEDPSTRSSKFKSKLANMGYQDPSTRSSKFKSKLANMGFDDPRSRSPKPKTKESNMTYEDPRIRSPLPKTKEANTKYEDPRIRSYKPKPANMIYENPSTRSSKPNRSSRSPNQELFSSPIYDADDEDTKSGSVASPVRNDSEDSAVIKRNNIKQAILSDFSDIIDGSDLPKDKKRELKKKLTRFIHVEVDELFSGPSKNMNKAMDFIDALEAMSLSKQENVNLLSQIADSVNSDLNVTIKNRVNVDPSRERMCLLIKNVLSILRLPDQTKDELMNKVHEGQPRSPLKSTNKKRHYSDPATDESFSPSTSRGPGSTSTKQHPRFHPPIPEKGARPFTTKRKMEEDPKISTPNENGEEDSTISTAKKNRDERPITSTPKKNREEGPIISTPRKGRKSWPEATELSTIADEDTLQSLSPEEQEFWDLLEDVITATVEDLIADLDEENQNEIREGLARDIKDRRKFLQMNPEARMSPQEELDNLQLQSIKRIIEVLSDEEKSSLEQESSGVLTDTPKKISQKKAADVVDTWIDTLPLLINSPSQQQQFDQKKDNFKSKIKELYPKSSPAQLMADIFKELRTWPLDRKKKLDEKYLDKKAKELVDNLDISSEQTPEKIMAHKLLDKLPLESYIKDPDALRSLKDDLASKLARDLQEINNNSKIFNNDTLHEEMLSKAIGTALNDLPLDADIVSDAKKDFIDQVLSQKNPGLAYKKQLKDTVLKALPEQEDPSLDEQANFEILKDDVADAFISLNYAGDNEKQKEKFKKQINDALDKYCDDYLAKHPDTLPDRKQLKKGLYAALKEVPLPPDDSLQSEVEAIRLKDTVNDWMNELPLKRQTPTERLETNKNKSALARKLRNIERNDANLNDAEVKNAMDKEIKTFLKQTPLQPGQDKNIDNFSKKLIEKLKTTAKGREFDASTRNPIDIEDIDTKPDKDVCPYYKYLQEKLKKVAQTCGKPTKTAEKKQQFPPCTLSDEDREHLERIRQRTCMLPNCLSSVLRGNKRNSSVGPMSVDAEVQTTPNSDRIPPCPSLYNRVSRPSGVSMRRTRSQCVQSDSRLDIEPQVIIKEYYWDSVNGCNREVSDSKLPTSVPRYNPISRFSGIKLQRCPQCSQRKIFDTSQGVTSGTSLPYIPSSCFPRVIPLRPSSPRPCTPKPSTSRSCTPRPGTPKTCRSPESKLYMPSHQSTFQKSCGPFFRDVEYKGPKRNGLQTEYPEPSNNRHCGRQERVIELGLLGSIEDLRRPYQRKRPEDTLWPPRLRDEGTSCSRDGSLDDDIDAASIRCMRGKNEERDRYDCMEKVMTDCAQRWARAHCHNHCNITSNCNDDSVKQCAKCCGVSCPYPSYLFFKQ